MSASIKLVDKKDRELMFEFRCLGDEIEKLDPRCCYESGLIFEHVQEGFIYELPIDTPKETMKLVNEFCVSRWEIINNTTTSYDDDAHHAARMLEDFGWKFVSKRPLSVLVQFVNVAIKLRIKSLLNLVRNAIVARLVGNSDEIHKIFDMSGFTRKAFEIVVADLQYCGASAYGQMV